MIRDEGNEKMADALAELDLKVGRLKDSMDRVERHIGLPSLDEVHLRFAKLGTGCDCELCEPGPITGRQIHSPRELSTVTVETKRWETAMEAVNVVCELFRFDGVMMTVPQHLADRMEAVVQEVQRVEKR